MAHFWNGVSVLGRILERGIKNWSISRTGYQFYGNFFLQRGANFESPPHTHPKNTQVPPPGSNDHSVRVKSVKVELQGEIQDTYLFTKDRGIKCCKVDISSEQSSMIDVPLN